MLSGHRTGVSAAVDFSQEGAMGLTERLDAMREMSKTRIPGRRGWSAPP
jgi:hypothetical protein